MSDNQPTAEQICKLPKWAQSHIRHLKQDRDRALALLDEYHDDQTKTSIWYEDMVWLDGGNQLVRKYVQNDKVEFDHAGVHLDVRLRHNDRIELSWRPGGGGHALGELSFVPSSYQAARISNPAYTTDEYNRLVALKEASEKRKESA